MNKRLTILLFLAFIRGSSAASCWFYYNINGYNCDLYDVNVQTESDVLEITGEHEPNYNNSRVDYVTILNLTMVVLHKNVLEIFPNVQQIKISSIGLQRFPDQAFGACSRLTNLDVEPNPLTTLQAGVFASCSELTGIYFRNGNLKEVSPEAFHGLGKLRALGLENNDIESLDARIFDQNRDLIILDLNGNKLSTLVPSVFAPLVNLQFLRLEGNVIEEIGATMFESLGSLVALYLQNCSIKKIHSDAFKTLESLSTLYLENNSIETVEPRTFASLQSLRALYLNQNRIKRLNANAFASNYSSANFILEFKSNLVDEVEEGLFDAFPRLMHVDALNNVCIDQLLVTRDLSRIPAEFKECYENWITPRSTTVTGSTTEGTRFPGSSTETTTQGAGTKNFSMAAIGILIFSLLIS